MNKKIWLVSAAIVLIAAGAVYLNRMKPPVPVQNTENNQPNNSSEQTKNEEPKPEDKPATKPAQTQPKPATPSSYGDAVKQYEGRRFQFNDSCQATPTSMAVKNGTSLMLDNRSNKSKTITFNLKKYTLEAYGYKIVTASNSALPATTFIDCNSSQNVATVNIQK
jgi:outer membrane protein OmpA-like peptidoglycan-associated protein